MLDDQSENLIRHWATENDCAADDENMESLVGKNNSEKIETLSRLHIGNYEGILGPRRRVSQRMSNLCFHNDCAELYSCGTAIIFIQYHHIKNLYYLLLYSGRIIY